MEITLNGKYWTSAHIQKVYGLSAPHVYRALNPILGKMVKVGRSYLIPEKYVRLVFGEIPDSVPQKKDTVAISSLIKAGYSYPCVKKLVDSGLPVIKMGNMTKITVKTFDILSCLCKEYRENYGCIPTCFIPELMDKFRAKYNHG